MKRHLKVVMILLTASALPLIAQVAAIGITLEKNGQQVLIPLDEWVAVSNANDPGDIFHGINLGTSVDALRILEKGESYERDVPLDEIGSIFRGKIKSTKEYVWDGIKLGGLVSVGIGSFITAISLKDSGLDMEVLPSILLFGGLWTVISGIYTIPAGALIGYIRAQVAKGNVEEYVIGDGEWVILR